MICKENSLVYDRMMIAVSSVRQWWICIVHPHKCQTSMKMNWQCIQLWKFASGRVDTLLTGTLVHNIYFSGLPGILFYRSIWSCLELYNKYMSYASNINVLNKCVCLKLAFLSSNSKTKVTMTSTRNHKG